MVKKWIIIISIILILTIGCVVETNYINQSFLSLEETLGDYKELIENTSESNLSQNENVTYIENLHKEWQEKHKTLKSLIWHSGLKDVEISLSRIQSYVESNEKTEAMAELNALIDYLEHYSEDFTISIENIL